MQTTIVVVILALFGAFFLLGCRDYSKSTSLVEFFLSGGKLSFRGHLGSLVATNVSLGNMIYVCAISGYVAGWSGVFWMAVCIILLGLGFWVFSSHFKAYVEDTSNVGTIHEYIAHPFRSDPAARKIRFFAALTTVLGVFVALVLELHLTALLFSQLLNVNIFIAFTAIVIAVGGYTVLGGYRTVVTSDIAQSIAMIIALAAGVLFFFIIGKHYSLAAAYPFSLQKMVTDYGWPGALGIAFLGFGWLLVTMDSWQRNCATRQLRRDKKSTLTGTVILTMTVVLFSLAGMAVKAYVEPQVPATAQLSNGLYPFNDAFLLAPHATPTQGFLLGIVAVGLLLAGMSTANTFLFVTSHSLVSDILIGLGKSANYSQLSEKQHRVYTTAARVVILTLTFGAFVGWALLRHTGVMDNPLSYFFVAYSVQYALMAPILATMLKKRPSARSVLYSLGAGLITSIVVGTLAALATLYRSKNIYLGLSPADWSSLCPLITFLAGAAALFLAGTSSKTKNQPQS